MKLLPTVRSSNLRAPNYVEHLDIEIARFFHFLRVGHEVGIFLSMASEIGWQHIPPASKQRIDDSRARRSYQRCKIS